MSFDRALGYVIDYTKFIATLWATYIGLNVTIIGWLLTLRGMKIELSWLTGGVVILTYVGVSFIFREVLHHNHRRLLGLMEIADALAELEAGSNDKLKEIYGRVSNKGDAPALLRKTETTYLRGVASVAVLFMALIVFLPPPTSSPAAATNQAAPAR
jgi:hypothetical protein